MLLHWRMVASLGDMPPRLSVLSLRCLLLAGVLVSASGSGASTEPGGKGEKKISMTKSVIQIKHFVGTFWFTASNSVLLNFQDEDLPVTSAFSRTSLVGA